MPFLKPIEKFQPPWKDWDKRAQKEGLHATFYTTNKDQYTGDWHDNKKEGKGVYNWVSKGEIYEGEWKADKRNGFGNLSVKQKDQTYKKVYSGGWKNNKRHVSSRRLEAWFGHELTTPVVSIHRATEPTTTPTTSSTRASSSTTNDQAGAECTTRTGTFMKANGWPIKDMATECFGLVSEVTNAITSCHSQF